MQHFLDLFISINCSTCFRRFLHPSSGAQNCAYSVRYCQTNTAACCYRGWDGTRRFLDLFISINCSTCFRRFLRPSSAAHNCNTASGIVKPILQPAVIVDKMESRQYLTLYVQFCDPDDGQSKRLKHVEQFMEINGTRKRFILLVVLYRYFRDRLHGEMVIRSLFFHRACCYRTLFKKPNSSTML